MLPNLSGNWFKNVFVVYELRCLFFFSCEVHWRSRWPSRVASLSRLNDRGGWRGTLSWCPTKRGVDLEALAPPSWCKVESSGAHSPAMKCFSELTHDASSIHTNHWEHASWATKLKGHQEALYLYFWRWDHGKSLVKSTSSAFINPGHACPPSGM